MQGKAWLAGLRSSESKGGWKLELSERQGLAQVDVGLKP